MYNISDPNKAFGFVLFTVRFVCNTYTHMGAHMTFSCKHITKETRRPKQITQVLYTHFIERETIYIPLQPSGNAVK